MTDDFAGFSAYGTTVEIEVDSSDVEIWGVGDVTGPQLSTDVSDTTNHSSPGRTEQRVATVKRVGTISFPMVVKAGDPGQAALYETWFDQAIANFTITKPSGIVHSFPAYVTQFGDGAPVTAHESIEVILTPSSWPEGATTFPGS